jgi:Tannase and feruloyl esterase
MSRPQRLILTRTGIVRILALTFVLIISGLGSGVSSVAAQSSSVVHTMSAQAVSSLPVIAPVISCATLAQHDFGGVPDAPTSIQSATVVATTSTTPEYCDVKGYISPQTQFELKLPTRTYQGRYLQVGCGGFCGSVSPTTFPSCDAQLGGDFAIATDNQGHMAASAADGVWALDDLQLRIEFGFLSEHAMAQSAKAIIATFYGQQPRYAYFNGCSDGGHEALQEAQRYPNDFNGIIAGAPANIWAPLNAEFQPWIARANLDAQGHQILTADKLPALHAAVLKACASVDQLIDDPRTCHFDPASMQCPGSTNTATCLTPAQVETVRKLYEGPVDAQGHHLYIGGEPYGSELAWAGWIVTPAGVEPIGQAIGDNYLKYQAFQVGKVGPSFQDWQFTVAGFNTLRPMGDIYNSTNADLSSFRAHGGKLIIWQGWADQAIPPFGTPVYYDAVLDRMGNLQQVQQFARLFMFPSMYHCAGGYGPNQFDMVAPMVAWVEQGIAPGKILATQTDNTGQAVRTFPVFPYPEQTKYTGQGSVNDANNYVGVMPQPLPDDDYNWVGNDLFNTREGAN